MLDVGNNLARAGFLVNEDLGRLMTVARRARVQARDDAVIGGVLGLHRVAECRVPMFPSRDGIHMNAEHKREIRVGRALAKTEIARAFRELGAIDRWASDRPTCPALTRRGVAIPSDAVPILFPPSATHRLAREIRDGRRRSHDASNRRANARHIGAGIGAVGSFALVRT